LYIGSRRKAAFDKTWFYILRAQGSAAQWFAEQPHHGSERTRSLKLLWLNAQKSKHPPMQIWLPLALPHQKRGLWFLSRNWHASTAHLQ